MKHITLPALDENGTVVTREVLEVDRAEDDSLRLLHSPAYVHGIAAGDCIELAEDEATGFRVLSRSGMLAVVFSVREQTTEAEATCSVLDAWVVGVGGSVDGGPRRLHVYSIPVSVGFDEIERRFDIASASIAGADWWYGNVYDLSGETELGWWHSSQA